MSDDKQEIVFVCNCGCISFIIHDAGMIECSNCSTYHDGHADNLGKWVESLPPIPNEITETDSGTINHKIIGEPQFAKRMAFRDMEKWLKENTLSIIVGFNSSGAGSHWFNVRNDDDKNWAINKLQSIIDYLKSMKA